MKVEPIIQQYRQLTPCYHPYGHTPSPPGTPSDNKTSICPRILPLMKKLDQKKTQSLSPTMKRPTLEHSKDRRPGDIVFTPVPDPCLYLLIDEPPPPSTITFNNADDPSMALDHLTNQMMKSQGQSGTLSKIGRAHV